MASYVTEPILTNLQQRRTLRELSGGTRMNYIPLRRRFAEYIFQNADRDGWEDIYSSDLYARFTWNDVLENRCTVVVGESGTGKSAEFKHRAADLRSNGKAGFFCRLEDLAILPLQSALEIGGPAELEAWLAGTDEGWFFLDAIDEAKLINSTCGNLNAPLANLSKSSRLIDHASTS
jgi:hypothetical protein